MDEIGEFLSNLQFQCRHVYREANGVADFLASLAVKSGLFEGVLPSYECFCSNIKLRLTIRRRRFVLNGQQLLVGPNLWRGFGVLVSGFQYCQSVSASEVASRYGVQKEGAGMLMSWTAAAVQELF
ncbi:unnamed protein product [Ilex paraguariensis]|uniref:RNase H type-1 domain-containing protein n=1 Tax=Ilex paraguariensis TaxID=185542 RepID=A0ABC8TXR2_9AQUA